MMRKLVSLCAIAFTTVLLYSQTVGIMLNSEASVNGYTLFAPSAYEHTYLIDNCGMIINEWVSNHPPGQSAYLIENGNLLRTARISGSFSGGGSGGRLEMFDWNGELFWAIDYSTNSYHQHHDVEYLPNGNILVIAWEKYTAKEAIATGRNPELMASDELWPDRIAEIRPVGTNDFVTVWEWHVWDHLIQDFDSTKANFGVVSEHPELIDINYTGGNPGFADWIHFNSIDYNAELDQILVSSRNFNEIWIIDHSTTTEEAAGHSGGQSGMGGDLIYRWGNPQAYDRGDSDDRIFYGQHDAQWISENTAPPHAISVFNNGAGRPGPDFSSVDVLVPPLKPDTTYLLPASDNYGPDTLLNSYNGFPDNGFFSSRISGAQHLESGNILICEGTMGRFFEVDTAEVLVWEYQNPVTSTGPVAQGQIPTVDDVFKVIRYTPDDPVFNGLEVIPGEPVENDPWPADCIIYDQTSALAKASDRDVLIHAFPNPADEMLLISSALAEPLQIVIFSVMGREVYRTFGAMSPVQLQIAGWNSGVYILSVRSENGQSIGQLKVIKR